MVHDLEMVNIYATIILMIIAFILGLLLYLRQRRTRIYGLKILVVLFELITLFAALELMSEYLHQYITLLDVDDDLDPVIKEPVKWINWAFIFILYVFCERIISVRFHPLRILIISSLTSATIIIGILSLSSGRLYFVNDIINTAPRKRLDGLFFDTYQLFVTIFAFYTFLLQYQTSRETTFQRLSLILAIAMFLFVVSMTIEVLEFFIVDLQIFAIVSGAPVIIVVAISYLIYPEFLYFTPTSITFLQVSHRDGLRHFSAKFDDNSKETLIAPGISSITTMIAEIVNENSDRFGVVSIDHRAGKIIMEHGQNHDYIVYVNITRDSMIIRQSLRYFLKEFVSTYQSELSRGKIINSDFEPNPITLLQRCVPVLEKVAAISIPNSTT